MVKNSKINQKRLLIIPYILIFFTSSVLMPLSISVRVFAGDASNFAMYTGISPSSKKDIADCWNDADDSYDNSCWNNMRIYAKELFGQKKVTINYDTSLTSEIACGGGSLPGTNGDCESREPFFTYRYYCSLPDHKLATSAPGDGVEYYEIVYAIGLKGNSESGDDFVNQDTINSYGGVILAKKFEFAEGNNYTREVVTRDITDVHMGPDDIVDPFNGNKNGRDDNKWGVDEDDQACRPSPDVVGEMSIPALTKDNQKDFVPKGTNPDVGGVANNETADLDCEGSFGFGWILCPVYELGANTTSTAFNDIIKPMLEDVPVNTKQNSGFYKAWNNFRVLANVVLVGAMLVLVYGMSRGDGR